MNSDEKQERLFDEQHKELKTQSVTEGECVFCKIVKGEAQGYVVYNDEVSMAFLDIKPLFQGHCLLVPRLHFESFADLPSSLIDPMFSNAQFLSKAVEKAMASDGTFVAINNKVSQSVPHFHIHVIPRKFKDGLKGFFWPRQKYEDDLTIKAIQQKISTAVLELHQ